MTSTPPSELRHYPGRLYLALGLVLPVIGVIGYALQMWAERLTIPWYMPGLATLGVICVAVSLWQARSACGALALLLVVLFCAVQWLFLFAMRLPDYVGPVTAEQPFPRFATLRADGSAFTERDLQGDQDAVLVFFRGRW